MTLKILFANILTLAVSSLAKLSDFSSHVQVDNGSASCDAFGEVEVTVAVAFGKGNSCSFDTSGCSVSSRVLTSSMET